MQAPCDGYLQADPEMRVAEVFGQHFEPRLWPTSAAAL